MKFYKSSMVEFWNSAPKCQDAFRSLFPKAIPSSVHVPIKQHTNMETVTRECVQILSYFNWFMKAIGKTSSSTEEFFNRVVQMFSGTLTSFYPTFKCSRHTLVHLIRLWSLSQIFPLLWPVIYSLQEGIPSLKSVHHTCRNTTLTNYEGLVLNLRTYFVPLHWIKYKRSRIDPLKD